MIDPRVQTLVRECRNMQLHVLWVWWASPEPLLAKEIAQEINCSSDAVQQALPQLEFNGYVSRLPGGRHPRWWLTDKGRPLSLPGMFGKSEGEKITLNPKVVAALKAAGIGSNAWPGLAKLEHVTPACVKAHDAYRRERGASTLCGFARGTPGCCGSLAKVHG